jgi:hypothetical protein
MLGYVEQSVQQRRLLTSYHVGSIVTYRFVPERKDEAIDLNTVTFTDNVIASYLDRAGPRIVILPPVVERGQGAWVVAIAAQIRRFVSSFIYHLDDVRLLCELPDECDVLVRGDVSLLGRAKDDRHRWWIGACDFREQWLKFCELRTMGYNVHGITLAPHWAGEIAVERGTLRVRQTHYGEVCIGEKNLQTIVNFWRSNVGVETG